MNILYTESDFKNAKSRSRLKLQCKVCHKHFYASKNVIQRVLKGKTDHTLNYCSKKCNFQDKLRPVYIRCLVCQKSIIRTPSDLTKIKNSFCSHSCSAKYNNTHKTKGTRTSKLEIWLSKKLIKLYPNLEIYFNHKDAIQSELDIYIPSLKLAFEINGIFHYEPIFGHHKLTKIQENDKNKFQSCQQNNISLCIIDTSQQKYFKEKTAIPFLDIITKIINQNMEPYPRVKLGP